MHFNWTLIPAKEGLFLLKASTFICPTHWEQWVCREKRWLGCDGFGKGNYVIYQNHANFESKRRWGCHGAKEGQVAHRQGMPLALRVLLQHFEDPTWALEPPSAWATCSQWLNRIGRLWLVISALGGLQSQFARSCPGGLAQAQICITHWGSLAQACFDLFLAISLHGCQICLTRWRLFLPIFASFLS